MLIGLTHVLKPERLRQCKVKAKDCWFQRQKTA